MKIKISAAIDHNNAIGKDGHLPWVLKDDLKHFKKITEGHAVAMGRKTWESIGSKPLLGRFNFVISSNPNLQAPGAVIVSSPEEAIRKARQMDADVLWAIGGQKVYEAFLELADELVITLVDDEIARADAFFPNFDKTQFDRTFILDAFQNRNNSRDFVIHSYKRKEQKNKG